MPQDTDSYVPVLRAWDLLILALSVYILIALAIDLVLPLPEQVSLLIRNIDFLVCMILLTDFTRNFIRAPSKLAFMKWGWIDLLSSIPMVEPLRWGRLARVVRILRIVRIIRVGMTLHHLFRERRTETSSIGILSAFIITVFTGSIAILFAETAPHSTITTAGEALWWSIVTVTTVGYGDFYPVTDPGRLVATLLMIIGIGLFSMMAGTLASALTRIDRQQPQSAPNEQLLDEIRHLREEVRRLGDDRGNA